MLFEIQAIPFSKRCVSKQAKSVSAVFINKAVTETLEKLNYTYEDIANIKYSNEGSVKSISANSVKINKIKSDVILKIQKELDKQELYRFFVPLGAFTDLTVMNSLGPDVEINFRLTGSVNCSIKSKFEGAGVNQTIHHIYLVVKTDIITICPGFSKEINTKSNFEIAQTVIVGDIPVTYADIET